MKYETLRTWNEFGWANQEGQMSLLDIRISSSIIRVPGKVGEGVLYLDTVTGFTIPTSLGSVANRKNSENQNWNMIGPNCSVHFSDQSGSNFILIGPLILALLRPYLITR